MCKYRNVPEIIKISLTTIHKIKVYLPILFCTSLYSERTQGKIYTEMRRSSANQIDLNCVIHRKTSQMTHNEYICMSRP